MERRAGFPSIFALLLLFVVVAGCSGTPANLDAVQLTPGTSQTIAGGGTVHIAASVVNDQASAGVTWGLAPTTGSGSLSAVTSASVTYDAPASVSAATTVKVTAASVAHAGESATLSITVEPPPTITTTSLPSGSVGASYTATLTLTGGVPNFSWSVASGSLPAGLTLGSSTSSSVTISGTPTTMGAFNFTIKATDSAGESTTQSFTLTIGTGVSGVALLKGQFAFEFSGFNSGGAVVTAGSFTADGAGNITSGVEDFNSIEGPPKNQTFTGTYTLGSDDRGTLVFGSLTGAPTYAFAIDPTGAHGRLIEFDSSGIRGSGEIEKQTVTTCAADTISTTSATGENYVFGITGSAAAFSGVSTAGPVVVAGAFTALQPPGTGVPGSLTGEADINIPGISVPNPINTSSAPVLSGTFQATSQTARCTMSLTPQQTSSSLNFSVYPVSGSTTALTEAFVVETDKVQSTSPYVTVGRLIQQCIVAGSTCATSPFAGQSAGTFFTAASVGALSGEAFDSNVTPNIYLPDVAIAEMTGTGGVSFTMWVVENQAGSVGTYQSPFQANFVNLDIEGRVSTNLLAPFAPVFYIISQNEALCIGQINNNPFFGIFEPQTTGTFSASTIKGAFIEGTAAPATSPVQDFSGAVTLDGVSAVSGTQDVSTAAANTSAESVTGTYTGIASATGEGTYTLTAPSTFTGRFFIVTPTKFVLVTTTPGDLNPVLVIFGN